MILEIFPMKRIKNTISLSIRFIDKSLTTFFVLISTESKLYKLKKINISSINVAYSIKSK